MAAPRIENAELQSLYRTFISGCHILHYHGVLDAYGHLSVRHPTRPEVFIMSRYIAPGTISSPDDLIEYYVDNAEPVDPNSPKGYSERCIHSEVLKRFPGVHSVIHSHSEEVVPYSISGVPLRPCYHMAGFLGTTVPIFEVSEALQPGDKQDMLVRNTHLGAALAGCFSKDPNGKKDQPDHTVVLMRGHGFTVAAPSIEDCVLRAIYTQKNAKVQSTALTTLAAHEGNSSVRKIRYLSEEEAADAKDMTLWSAMRPWRLWLREVQAEDLYVNLA